MDKRPKNPTRFSHFFPSKNAMANADSVSTWIECLKGGDVDALQKIWQRYFHQLVTLARGRLSPAVRRVGDEEDVALSAFDSFRQGVARGRFPQLEDRRDLWCILLNLTFRKVHQLVKLETRQKRGGRALGGDSVAPFDLALLMDREPTPEIQAEIADEYNRLYHGLPDDSLRAVMQAKLEGYTNEEIADRLRCAVRTVERKLVTIRSCWMKEEAP
jgi:hypothetical protein